MYDFVYIPPNRLGCFTAGDMLKYGMVTIREIADLAGVSRGTVDRVLNKRGRVHPDTEKRIQKILNDLDYRLNSHGRALSMQKKKFNIAYIYPKSEINTFFNDVINGINAKVSELHNNNINLYIKPVKLNDTRLFLQTLNRLQKKNVDGIIITPSGAPEITEKINNLVDRGFTVVTCNVDSAKSKRLAFAGCNLYRMGYTAGGLMGIIAGRKARIGIVSSGIHKKRLKGFIDAITKNHPGMRIADIIEAEEATIDTYNRTKAMMKKHPGIQAIFAETVAVSGICKSLANLGLDGKVKVICFDDMPQIRNLMREGRVSAIVIQNPFWQGYRSFEMLWDYLLIRKIPEKELNYSVTEIRIKESLEEIENGN